MKRIGILTFQQADNYGALLQAYALKQVISQLTASVDIINYDCPAIRKVYEWTNGLSVQKPLQTLKQLIKWPFWYYRRQQFKPFRKQYLWDMPLVKKKDMPKVLEKYNVVISGSDQVFNPRITNFDTTYFLPFSGDTKYISYAASFGMSLDKLSAREKAFIQKNLSNLHRISVRETQGADIVHTVGKCSACVHLDPTLLMTSSQWKSIMTPNRRKPYVLLYLMHQDKALIHFAKQWANQANCQLLSIPSSVQVRSLFSIPQIVASPQEWVSLIAGARYVVTNSFHGLAFSINFNRPFFVGKVPDKAASNARLEHLLRLTGLQNRYYTKDSSCGGGGPIVWSRVNQKLEAQRQKAFSYIRKELEF